MSRTVLLAGESTTVKVLHVEATEMQRQKVIKCLTSLLPAAIRPPRLRLIGAGRGASDIYDFEIALKGPGAVDVIQIRKELSATGVTGFTINVEQPKL